MPPNLVSATLRRGLFTRVVGKRILFFQEISSTMDEAARQAQAGADEGLVVVAEVQTAGRGRLGRSWVSSPGNLYFSVLFRPPLPALPMISILAGVAVVRSIKACTGADPRIKWPNDVMLHGKKVGGILVETAVQGDQVAHAVLGIGINVDLDLDALGDIRDFTTNLSLAVNAAVSREALLRQLLHDLDALYHQAVQGVSVLPEWRPLLDTLGRRVQTYGRAPYNTGVAEDVDDLGNLLLRLDDGSLLTLTAGDVSLTDHQDPTPNPGPTNPKPSDPEATRP